MSNKKYVYSFAVLATIATLTVAVPALAATNISSAVGVNLGGAWDGHVGVGVGHGNMKPGVFGTVSAVSGDIITVTSTHRMGPKPATGSANTTAPVTATYTVDATNATITKNNVAGTISSIAVGDTIMAQGTLTGTNLVATTIRDGVMMRTPGATGQSGKNQPSPITGNGQPVVAGTVSSVSGNTLVITNKSNVTYTIDTTNAKIVQGQNTIAVSNVAVGDNVIVQGAVSGNSITASSVIDQKASATGTTVKSKGFFGSIGAFFSHLFGF
jgi:hypothetical protein